MKKITAFVATFFAVFSLTADPGNGIVKDSKGSIFYTDLSQVWKISPDGQKTIAVSGVHTHELYIDQYDNLYGEHLWYNGEQLNTWGSYAWRLSSFGKLDTLVGPQEGFMENYSFDRDSIGNMYWIQRWKIKRVIRKSIDGSTTVMVTGNFNHMSRLYVTKDGMVYFLANNNLYKITTAGHVSILAKGIGDENEYNLIKQRPGNSLSNVWVHQDTVYISDYTGRKVKRWSPSGKMAIIAQSSSPWSPSGGVIDHQGNLWIMEYSITNTVRLRKIQKNSPENSKKNDTDNDWWPVGLLSGTIAAALIVVISIKRKKSG
jgi:hypothetical protein